MKIPAFQLERYFAKYEFNAPYLLCTSDCESMSIGDLLELAGEPAGNFQSRWLGYTDSVGDAELRDSIASLYESVGPDSVLVHTGAEEAIFNFMNAVLEKGDHIFVHWPCYQSLFEVAKAVGCDITKWEGDPENGWELDPAFLETHMRPNTKAVIVNCPHNPTGYLMPVDKWRELDRLSKKHGFLVFSDEVYRFLEYRDEDRLPACCDMDDRSVSLGVMSKSFGLAGLRIGWIATRNRIVYEKMAAFKDYTTICNSAPSEWLATIALKNADRLVARNKEIIRENLDILNRFFENRAAMFDWNPPNAGPIAFPALKADTHVETFCNDLVEKAGVLLAPGTLYGEPFNRHFRIGFGRRNMGECVRKLETYLDGGQ